jgi:hypothetical protein
MPALDFPRPHVRLLHELGTRLLDSRKPKTKDEVFARELLVGFFDTCMHAGLDRVLVALEEACPPLDLADRASLADHTALCAALATRLQEINLDAGGPRNARPLQLAECLLGALGLTLADEPDQTIMLDHAVRTEVVAALASVVGVELAAPRIRETMISTARERCEPRYRGAFETITAQLDELAMRMIKQPKVPLDASQAVQRALSDARNAVFARVASTAIDRAKDKIMQANADAAARIDLPVTFRLTPRDVAILRVCDARVLKMPALVVDSLLESLTELSRLSWRAAERPVRPYAASQTFAVGELLEHPKFGRGTVVSCMARRIDVEFPDGTHTLVHVPPAK